LVRKGDSLTEFKYALGFNEDGVFGVAGLLGNDGDSFSLEDIDPIEATFPSAFSYIEVPGGPRTLLNLLQSYGVNQNSQNDGSSQWSNSFSGNIPYVANPISNSNYFTRQNSLRIIDGDGQYDPPDWTIFNFDYSYNWDFDGNSNNLSFFGGEQQASGGRGGIGANSGSIWGFSESTGWKLLFSLPLGSGAGQFNHQNPVWWNSGSTVTSDFGKRSEYDSLPITHLGFSVF
jgi:hypothetical protein